MTATPAPHTRRTPPPQRGGRTFRGRRARRGSIYAVVLGMSILVALIGLSTIAVSRINLRSTNITGEAGEAELLALSACEHAMTVVNTDSGWRNTYTHDTPVPDVALGRGHFTWKLMDDADSNLAGGGLQPVRVVGYGFVGVARRAFSVELLPAGKNLIDNPGFETGVSPFGSQGGGCNLQPSTTHVHDGTQSLQVSSRTAPSSGPQQEVTDKISSGRSYYVEAWVKMSTTAEEPVISLVARGTDLLLLSWSETWSATAERVGLEWTRVHVTLHPNWSGTADDIQVRFATKSTAQPFWLDDVKLIESSGQIPMAPGRETWKQEPVN
jgi:hypothetical protein